MDTAKIFFIGDGCLMEYSISDELEAEMRKVLVGMNYHVWTREPRFSGVVSRVHKQLKAIHKALSQWDYF